MMGRPAPRSQRTLALSSIADALAVFMEKRGGLAHAQFTRLWEHWDMVMGKEIASLATPIGHRKTALIIAAEDSMAAQDLAMQAEDIIERANAFMDAPFFTRIQVELVMGRNGLSRSAPTLRPRPPDYHTPKPDSLGALRGHFEDSDSPVARCYEAYIRYFSRRDRPGPKP